MHYSIVVIVISGSDTEFFGFFNCCVLELVLLTNWKPEWCVDSPSFNCSGSVLLTLLQEEQGNSGFETNQ